MEGVVARRVWIAKHAWEVVVLNVCNLLLDDAQSSLVDANGFLVKSTKLDSIQVNVKLTLSALKRCWMWMAMDERRGLMASTYCVSWIS